MQTRFFDVVCFSHTLDNVDSHFEFQFLDSLIHFWITFFSHSCNARLAWREKMGSQFALSVTHGGGVNGRCLSKCWTCLGMASLSFARTGKFVQQIVGISCKYFDPQSYRDLRLELAAVIDAGVHFVNATYYLEGDGLLIFSCYERLSAVAQAVAVDHYPNTEAVAREIANGNVAVYNQLMAQAKACIWPELNFYQRKFNVQFRDTVKSARFCCPVQVQGLRPTAASLEELRNFPFLNNDATISNLAQELPLYIAAADRISVACEEDKITCGIGGLFTETPFHTGAQLSRKYC